MDVRAAEGAKATRPELDFVRAGLEAGHGGVLLCRAEDTLVGYLWWVDTENCPYGPGCYADKQPFLWVHTVYTIPSHRRRGVARRQERARGATRGAGDRYTYLIVTLIRPLHLTLTVTRSEALLEAQASAAREERVELLRRQVTLYIRPTSRLLSLLASPPPEASLPPCFPSLLRAPRLLL